MQPNLPFTIATYKGEKLTFLRIVNKDGKEYLEVQSQVKPNAGPPMHVHYKQDECITVVEGKIGHQQFGQEKKYADAGATLFLKPAMHISSGMQEPNRFVVPDILRP
ncbi:MAG: hypothetical protein ACHQF0_02235 [Chitinophagales bacterium]